MTNIEIQEMQDVLFEVFRGESSFDVTMHLDNHSLRVLEDISEFIGAFRIRRTEKEPPDENILPCVWAYNSILEKWDEWGSSWIIKNANIFPYWRVIPEIEMSIEENEDGKSKMGTSEDLTE